MALDLTTAGTAQPVGLYIHVPFCRALCHYCDFAKTANFTAATAAGFWRMTTVHAAAWASSLLVRDALSGAPRYTSVFFGGGTPSLFVDEIGGFLDSLRAQSALAPGAEISLEANPDDVDRARAQAWHDAGVTRLSLGVQTFSNEGLAFLKRTHDGTVAKKAIEAALATFPTVNADLIYGWPGDTAASWHDDLSTMISLGVPHLSLYDLTYEGKTPIARAAARGLVKPAGDEAGIARFEAAREFLAARGFDHEEVSNWSKPGHACRHNWLYWSGAPYVGVGPGAHGFLPTLAPALHAPFGVRWHYPRSERRYVSGPDGSQLLPTAGLAATATAFGVEFEADRTSESWVMECIGTGLRTVRGVDLEALIRRTARQFKPRPAVEEGLQRGLLVLNDGRLTLKPSEWFRETAWSLEVAMSLPG